MLRLVAPPSPREPSSPTRSAPASTRCRYGCSSTERPRSIATSPKLEAELGRIIAAEPALVRRRAILLSIPGFGPVVAATFVAMLAGLAPIANDSGQRQGLRSIGGGRAAPRRVLYLAAIAALRFNPGMKAFYDHLTAQGKRAKLALVAVARTLAVLANTRIKEDRLWKPTRA